MNRKNDNTPACASASDPADEPANLKPELETVLMNLARLVDVVSWELLGHCEFRTNADGERIATLPACHAENAIALLIIGRDDARAKMAEAAR